MFLASFPLAVISSCCPFAANMLMGGLLLCALYWLCTARRSSVFVTICSSDPESIIASCVLHGPDVRDLLNLTLPPSLLLVLESLSEDEESSSLLSSDALSSCPFDFANVRASFFLSVVFDCFVCCFDDFDFVDGFLSDLAFEVLCPFESFLLSFLHSNALWMPHVWHLQQAFSSQSLSLWP